MSGAHNPAATKSAILSGGHAGKQRRRFVDRNRSVNFLASGIVSLALLLAISGCSSRAPERWGKGWELYSWQQGSDWHFSLILGVNNRKPVLELADVQQYGFVGIGKLKRKLSKLAIGQEVGWFNLGAQPVPTAMTEDLLRFCRRAKLELKVVPAQNNAMHSDSATTLVLKSNITRAQPVMAIR